MHIVNIHWLTIIFDFLGLGHHLVCHTEHDMSETMYVSIHNWKGERATQMAWLEISKLHCRMEMDTFTKMLSYFQNIKQVTKSIHPLHHLQNHLEMMHFHLKTKHSPFFTNLPQFLLYLSISFLFSIPSFCYHFIHQKYKLNSWCKLANIIYIHSPSVYPIKSVSVLFFKLQNIW